MNLKNTYLLKKLLNWANKRCKNFNIYNVVILNYFCPFTPLTMQKIKILKKWKMPGDIMRYCHFTQVYHEWKSYDVWFLSSRQNVFLFWIIFYPFNPLTTQKIKILKNCKKHLECHHDAHVYHKSKSWCIVPETWTATYIVDSIFCHFGPSFALLPP